MTSFVIDGGAGRLITAMPALEKYARLNPEDDFRVLTAAWESLMWCHPMLQQRTFNINQKGMFDLHMRHRRLVHPEPYMLHDYYNQRIHLTQAFDREINQTTDHSDLGVPKLWLSQQEIAKAKQTMRELKHAQHKSHVTVIQPYGSGMVLRGDRPHDPTHRSLDVDFYLQLAHALSKHSVVIFFGEQQFAHPGDSHSVNFFDAQPDLRMYAALISQCDHFVGIDSVGQHMARSFHKPGTVIMSSTFETNVSYAGHFCIHRNKYQPTYVPIRISSADCDFANLINEPTAQFTNEDVAQIMETVFAR